MKPENFDRSLRTFVRRKPYKPFQVRFADGSAIIVDHPEALVLRGGVAVYISAQGEPTLFDHHSVSQLSARIDSASA